MEEEDLSDDVGSGQLAGDDGNIQTRIFPTIITIQSAWYSFVFTLGVIGNLYVVLTVMCRRKKYSTTNLFIVNLALSDLGIVLISLPAEYIKDYFPWPFDNLTCQIFVPLNEVFFCVSICTLTVITLERYRVICKPMKRNVSEKQAKIIIVVVWFASYITAGFPISFLMKVETIGGYVRCWPHWPSDLHRRLHTCFIAALILIPLFITATGYTAIVRSMRKNSARIRKRASSICSATDSFRQDMIRLEQNTKLIKMLLLIVTVFWICMLPLVLLALSIEFGSIDPTSKEVEGLYTFSTALFYTNSAFNPIAVYIMSSELRQGYYSFRRKFMKSRF